MSIQFRASTFASAALSKPQQTQAIRFGADGEAHDPMVRLFNHLGGLFASFKPLQLQQISQDSRHAVYSINFKDGKAYQVSLPTRENALSGHKMYTLRSARNDNTWIEFNCRPLDERRREISHLRWSIPDYPFVTYGEVSDEAVEAAETFFTTLEQRINGVLEEFPALPAVSSSEIVF